MLLACNSKYTLSFSFLYKYVVYERIVLQNSSGDALFSATPEHEETWKAATRTAYDPFVSAGSAELSRREVVCPHCSQVHHVCESLA